MSCFDDDEPCPACKHGICGHCGKQFAAANGASTEPLYDGLSLDEVKKRLALLNADDLRGLVVSQLIMSRIEHKYAPLASTEPARKQLTCDCQTCRPITMNDMRMVLCATCGNKRCPHANDHRNACTNSNEPGQSGSAYLALAALAAGEPTDEPAGQEVSDEQIDAFFVKHAGVNDYGVSYLRCYSQAFRHIARDLIALACASRPSTSEKP